MCNIVSPQSTENAAVQILSKAPYILLPLGVRGTEWRRRKKKKQPKKNPSPLTFTLFQQHGHGWLGEKRLRLLRLKKRRGEKKNPRVSRCHPSPRCCVPELIEGLIAKVHFTNGCLSHSDQFFVPLLNPPFSCVYGPVRGRQICLQFAGDELGNLFKIRLTPVCLIMQRFLAFGLQFSRFKC